MENNKIEEVKLEQKDTKQKNKEFSEIIRDIDRQIQNKINIKIILLLFMFYIGYMYVHKLYYICAGSVLMFYLMYKLYKKQHEELLGVKENVKK